MPERIENPFCVLFGLERLSSSQYELYQIIIDSNNYQLATGPGTDLQIGIGQLETAITFIADAHFQTHDAAFLRSLVILFIMA